MRFTKSSIVDLARMCSLVYNNEETISKKYGEGRPYNKNQEEIDADSC